MVQINSKVCDYLAARADSSNSDQRQALRSGTFGPLSGLWPARSVHRCVNVSGKKKMKPMISIELKAKIRRLYYAEHWKVGTIASQLGLHPDTVRATIETERFNNRRAPRACATDPYIELIKETLDSYPRLRATRIYQMLVDRGYKGSVVQLRRAVATLRPSRREAFNRLRTLPGEQAQADWACFGQVTIGRAKRRLSCFVVTLSYSRALWLEFFFDQTLENFLLGHVHAFEDWGGVARTILYDNLRSVVVERYGDAIHFNQKLLELSAHYHFAARPCRPARGNEKGRIERAIQYIRHSFFAGRSFTTLSDFNNQALAWRNQVAYQRPWPADDSRTVVDALQEEKPLLLPLPVHSFNADLVRPVRSDKTIYIRFDLNDYSIPPECVRRPLTLVASPMTVRLLDGSAEVACHRRSYDRHQQIQDPAHIEALIREKRKALSSTAHGRLAVAIPNIGDFLDAAFRAGESIHRLTTRLLLLLDEWGEAQLHAAVSEALQRQTPRLSSVAYILGRHGRNRPLSPVDLSRRPDLAQVSVPSHRPEVYDELSDDDSDQ
jgi:transposase